MRSFLILLITLRCFSSHGQILEPDKMHADLAVLKAAWTELHPGLYRYNTKEQIEELFVLARQKTSQPISKRQFFILLSQLNTAVRCGHTFVSFYNQKRVIEEALFSKAFLPLAFRMIGRQMVITHNFSNFSAIRPGDEIIAINGIPANTILDSLLTVSKTDGQHGIGKQLDNIGIYPVDLSPKKYTLFDVFFPLFFKPNLNDSTFYVTIRRAKKDFSYQLIALTKEARQAAFIEKYGNLPSQEKSWYTQKISNNTVLFRLGDFAVYNWKFDFKKYIDSTFLDFSNEGFKNLIIDIRQNEGGSEKARDEVLSYLTANPIACYNKIRRLYKYLRVPNDLLPYLKTWDEEFKKPKPENQFARTSENLYEAVSNTCDTLPVQKNRFKGKVFLITDVTNSSATFLMADIFKRYRLGTIVGETTGGTQQGINGGEFFFLYLPNSGIEMDLPLVFQTPPQVREDVGIHPDYKIPTTKDDISKGRDPQLNFILTKLLR